MPNRIIKESICTSDSVDRLTWFEEALFYRLIVNCDDYGRFDGRIAIIKNRLFPLKENLTAKTVKDGINKLASVGLVSLYEVDGKPYLHLPTWNDHQNVRATRSKYPAPEEGLNTSEYICNQMQSDASKCTRESNPIQSESKSESKCVSAGFDLFWDAYPKKKSKQAAEKAFKKVKVPVEVLMAAVERQKQSKDWLKDGGQFIPYPATWLNQGRWEDEVDGVIADSSDTDDFGGIF